MAYLPSHEIKVKHCDFESAQYNYMFWYYAFEQ